MIRVFFLIALGLYTSGYGDKHHGHGESYSKCESDKKSLCGEGSAFANETKTNCLQEQFEKIKDKACKEQLEASRKGWQKLQDSFKAVKKTCDAIVDKECPEDKTSQKNYKVCLMMNSGKLSLECKNELNRHIKEHLPGIREVK
ncbi:hypothetical protein [Pseudobacteriovorax antillogorgiicola]|uniref:Uncharacterized protein n=1 Tax=Pseudobacteriovorax antillogorgiicola TaxID=1513793 RepID=A0A1Y6BYN8_9BACT|nr:hypothetical protein [Pseudobacteriovorax antillogorgiicola]TCS51264.1 hypothetical protein EDD56_111149 [Pseudobacteriovorax antillogorgiicola]SMF36412.1 hypothetical protein SAMN06296036_11129 [Pseudobacteriovorax antillogorgiicola]